MFNIKNEKKLEIFEKLSDIKIINIDKEYNLNKIVLTQIPYFEKIFLGNFAETNQKVIETEFLPSSWEKILQYIYLPLVMFYGDFRTSKMKAFDEILGKWDGDDAILADLLGLEELRDKIYDYVIDKIFGSTNLEYRTWWRDNEMKKIIRKINKWSQLSSNRKIVLGSDRFDEFIAHIINDENMMRNIIYRDVPSSQIINYPFFVVSLALKEPKFKYLINDILPEILENLDDDERKELNLPIGIEKLRDKDDLEYLNEIKNFSEAQDFYQKEAEEGFPHKNLLTQVILKFDYPSLNQRLLYLVDLIWIGNLDLIPELLQRGHLIDENCPSEGQLLHELIMCRQGLDVDYRLKWLKYLVSQGVSIDNSDLELAIQDGDGNFPITEYFINIGLKLSPSEWTTSLSYNYDLESEGFTHKIRLDQSDTAVKTVSLLKNLLMIEK